LAITSSTGETPDPATPRSCAWESAPDPAFLAAARVVRDRYVGPVEIVDRLEPANFGLDASPYMHTLVLE
jgi:hypothetical protein